MLAAAARSRDRDRTRLFGTGRFKRRGGFILLLVCWDRAPAGVRQQGQYEEDGNRAGTPGQRGRTLGGKVPMYGGGPGSQGTLRRRSVGAMGAGLLSRRWRLECPGRAFTLPIRLLHAVRSTLQRSGPSSDIVWGRPSDGTRPLRVRTGEAAYWPGRWVRGVRLPSPLG
jgi:hypothetical protein